MTPQRNMQPIQNIAKDIYFALICKICPDLYRISSSICWQAAPNTWFLWSCWIAQFLVLPQDFLIMQIMQKYGWKIVLVGSSRKSHKNYAKLSRKKILKSKDFSDANHCSLRLNMKKKKLSNFITVKPQHLRVSTFYGINHLKNTFRKFSEVLLQGLILEMV